MILGSQHIDHTNLKPNATTDDIRKLCEEAKEHNFRGVCVHPGRVRVAAQSLINIDIKLVTVIGFPLGANTTKTKILEAEEAMGDGVDEIDVVWDIGAFKAGEYLRTVSQLHAIVEAVEAGQWMRNDKRMVKVIVEICYLDINELEKAYQIVLDSGADCIKTSTGFGHNDGMDNQRAVKIWKRIKGNLKIKASAGIRYRKTAQSLIDCGADILGTSSGVSIMGEMGGEL